jgi:hypothetical protein
MDDLRDRLNLETGKISWSELQKHYAAGNVMAVCKGADLIEIAIAFHEDNRSKVESWLSDKTLFEIDDQLALKLHETDAEHWAVVIPPFVLVQET